MSKVVFKNIGKSFNDFKKSEKFKINTQNKIKKPIGIDFPLKEKSTLNETLFKMTYDVNDQVKVNLKNLILTRKGEYLCLPDFGTNLIQLYNSTEIEDIEEIAMDEIKKAVSLYMPYVSLENFTSNKVKNTLENTSYHEIKIDYNVEGLNKKNTITIKLLMSR